MFLHSSSRHFHFLFIREATPSSSPAAHTAAASLGRCYVAECRNWVTSTTVNNEWGHSVTLLLFQVGLSCLVWVYLLRNAKPFTILHNTHLKWTACMAWGCQSIQIKMQLAMKNTVWRLFFVFFVYHCRRVIISSMKRRFTVVEYTHALESISYIHLAFLFIY